MCQVFGSSRRITRNPEVGRSQADLWGVIPDRHFINRSYLGLRVKGLTTLEHFDEGLDLLFPPGRGLHVVSAEGQREAVLSAEFLQHFLRLGLGVDGSLEIVG